MARKLNIVIPCFLVAFVIAAVVLVVREPVVAHHSFAATYDESKEQTVEGDMVQFVFRNPHSFVHIDVGEPTGTKRYSVEWASGSSLNAQGVTRDTLKFGDHVVIVGQPGRNVEDRRLRMRKITRPADGWTWGGDFQ